MKKDVINNKETPAIEQAAFQKVEAEFMLPIYEKMWAKMKNLLHTPDSYKEPSPKAVKTATDFFTFIETLCQQKALDCIQFAWTCLGAGMGNVLAHATFQHLTANIFYELQAIYLIAQRGASDIEEEEVLELVD